MAQKVYFITSSLLQSIIADFLCDATAVADGKLTQAQLNQLHRIQGAHANSVEHFPLFVAALLWAHFTGVPHAAINTYALAYTITRLVYVAAYVFITDAKWSLLRGVAWWVSNTLCLLLIGKGGKSINSGMHEKVNQIRPNGGL